jgi:hypothetical protein
MAKSAVTSVAHVKPINLGRKGLKIHGCSNVNSSEKWCPSAGISTTLSAALTGNTLTVPTEVGMSYYNCLKFYLFLLQGVAADVEKYLITEV